MKKILIFALIILLISGVCHADSLKGTIEKVDPIKHEIFINGKRIDVSGAVISTENEMHVTKTIIMRDLKDHLGSVAVCYGSINKDGIFSAYKVRVYEGHW